MDEFRFIIVEVDQGVAQIELNRPDRLNAFTLAMGEELSRALTWCDETHEVRSVIVTGGGGVFCAGADLEPDQGAYGEEAVEEFVGTQPQLRPPYSIRKPVIAAMNGHAVGIGLTLALQCDIRYAADDAKLSFPFVRLGIVPENAAHWILPRVVGLARAARLLLSGEPVSGREAAELGLVNASMPKADVVAAARDTAKKLARGAPVSVALTKAMLWKGLSEDLETSKFEETSWLAWTARQPDAEEGAKAFLEKRQPVWRGKVTDIPRAPEG